MVFIIKMSNAGVSSTSLYARCLCRLHHDINTCARTRTYALPNLSARMPGVRSGGGFVAELLPVELVGAIRLNHARSLLG